MIAVSTTVAAHAATESAAAVGTQAAAAGSVTPATAKTAQHSETPSSPSAIVSLNGSDANEPSLVYGAITAPPSSHAVPHEHDVFTNALLQILPDSEGGIDVAQIPGAPVAF